MDHHYNQSHRRRHHHHPLSMHIMHTPTPNDI